MRSTAVAGRLDLPLGEHRAQTSADTRGFKCA